MERLMPIDLERQSFRKAFRGYDTSEVDTLIHKVSQTLEGLLAENRKLKEELDRARLQLDRTETDANAIRETMVLAQRASEEARANANQHAAVILEEARMAAMAERVSNQQRVSELRWEFEKLRSEKDRFLEEYRSMLQRQLRALDPIPGYAVVEGAVVDEAVIDSVPVAVSARTKTG